MAEVTINRSPGFPDIAIVLAGPDIARQMGTAWTARYRPDDGGFWIESKHLETFLRDLTRKGHTWRDKRPAKRTRPPGRCGFCHQVHHPDEPHLSAPDPARNARGAAMVRAAMRGELVIPEQTTLEDVQEDDHDDHA